ncbi:MAG: electron transfer flavoprotein subunit alpha [Sulfolobaceae archaeon]|nr:electron transfer flavoprotein subunit alpha [Sulfolobaceae archaeon]
MNVVAGFKVVLDDTLIKVVNGQLDFNVPLKVSNYDKNAVEEAVELKEKYGGTAIGVTVGIDDRKSIKDMLAMGLDEVRVVKGNYFDALSTAEAIIEATKDVKTDLYIFAEQTTDGNTSSVPAMLASLLDLPLLSYVKSLRIDGRKVIAERSLGLNSETLEAELPAVISVTGEINKPRVPTVRQVLEASKKPIKYIEFSSQPKVKIVELNPYVVNRKRVIIEGNMKEAVDKLITYLKEDGVL